MATLTTGGVTDGAVTRGDLTRGAVTTGGVTTGAVAGPVQVEISAEMQRAVEQFLYLEAHLLDNRSWALWDALFTDDGMYWVPLAHDQEDPLNHASLFYEDAILRDVRRRRLEQKHAWSQQPVTRSARIVGNVMPRVADDGTLRVHSTFQMTEWRKGRDLRQLAGHYTHTLIADGSSWRIRLKRVDLINCDGIHDSFEIFI